MTPSRLRYPGSAAYPFPMSSSLIRRTALGAVIGGGLFLGVALVQVLRTDVSPVRVLQPLLVLAVLGATVGALGGPLLGGAWRRWREPQG